MMPTTPRAAPAVLRSLPLRLLGALAALGLTSACAPDSTPDSSDRAASTAQAVLGVPGAPTSPNERIGLYVSPANTSGYSFGDLVNGPTGLVTQVGSRVVRLFFSNPDKFTGVQYGSGSCPIGQGPCALSAEATTNPYYTLFTNPRIDTFILTTYTLADDPANGCLPTWLNGLSGSDAANETNELENLAVTLRNTYPSKKFILINWEGDSALGSLEHYCPTIAASGIMNTDTPWQGYTDWINARVAGVVNARNSYGASNVFSGVEFNSLQRTVGNDYYGNSCYPQGQTDLGGGCSWCDGSHNCVISRVIPHVPNVDYLSYSAWQSVGVPNAGDVSNRLQNDLNRARGFATGAQPANFIIGEFGADRFQFGESVSATRMSSAITSMESWGVSYGVYWQILDNCTNSNVPCTPSETGYGFGFGAFEPNGAMGSVGQLLHSQYTPAIGGVVDDSTGISGQAHPGQYISIYGTNLFGSTNAVYIAGMSASISYNTATQINAIVPAGVAGGTQTVQVYDPYSGQSVSTTVNIIAAGPSISYVYDYATGAYNTAHIGSQIAIMGSGFGSTNSVYLGGWGQSVSYNSSTQIIATVTSAPTGNQTLQVYVPSTGQSAYLYNVTVIGAPSVTCSLSAPSSVSYGSYWNVSVTSSPGAGYGVYWYGTHNGSQDATNIYAGTTQFSSSYGPYTNTGDTYTRYAVLRDGSGNAVCTTNTVSLSVGGGSSCTYYCSNYGVSNGQCYYGWLCEGQCLVYTGCQ